MTAYSPANPRRHKPRRKCALEGCAELLTHQKKYHSAECYRLARQLAQPFRPCEVCGKALTSQQERTCSRTCNGTLPRKSNNPSGRPPGVAEAKVREPQVRDGYPVRKPSADWPARKQRIYAQYGVNRDRQTEMT